MHLKIYKGTSIFTRKEDILSTSSSPSIRGTRITHSICVHRHTTSAFKFTFTWWSQGEGALLSINKEGCLWHLGSKILNTYFHKLRPGCPYHKTNWKLNRLRLRSLKLFTFVSEYRVSCSSPRTIRVQRDLRTKYSISKSWLGHERNVNCFMDCRVKGVDSINKYWEHIHARYCSRF